MFKSLKIMCGGIILLHLLYLAIIWVWASVNATEVIRESLSASHDIELQQSQYDILLKIEDPTFHEHIGLSLANGQGLTTITSALARDVFLYRHRLDGISGAMQSFYRGVFNCCKKIDIGRDVMALVLHRHVTKQQQLNLLLSTSYMGGKAGKAVTGFPAAAMAYYNKSIHDLSAQEFAGLVAMIAAPTHYHPINNPELHAVRTARIINIVDGHCEPDGLLDLTYEHC